MTRPAIAPSPGLPPAASPALSAGMPFSSRLGSIDVYRGGVMVLMMAEALRLSEVAKALPGNAFWAFLARQQTHVEWVGCVLHDLIQPSFSFLVGVALPFSLASRLARGQSLARLTRHALVRAVILVLLGVFLRSVGRERTNFTFEDTLSQIGLGYPVLFLLGLRTSRAQWWSLGGILLSYWLLFAVYPAPGAEFDYPAVGVPADWPHLMQGFQAHWNKNSNPAWAFDTWFLNLFPREQPFRFNGGGYATLSFIPTLATMILGLIAGGILREGQPSRRRVLRLAGLGVAATAAGWALGELGLCPIVKRIWTPSWTLFSGGLCLLILAALHAMVDLAGVSRWAYPLRVVGMNSIAAYCLAHLVEDFIRDSLHTHLGRDVFRLLGPPYEPLLEGAGVLLVLWLILCWMDRRQLYLKI